MYEIPHLNWVEIHLSLRWLDSRCGDSQRMWRLRSNWFSLSAAKALELHENQRAIRAFTQPNREAALFFFSFFFFRLFLIFLLLEGKILLSNADRLRLLNASREKGSECGHVAILRSIKASWTARSASTKNISISPIWDVRTSFLNGTCHALCYTFPQVKHVPTTSSISFFHCFCQTLFNRINLI